MKAIILKAVGGPENLELAEIAVPSIKDDEVLVKVKAISINPVDAFARRNQDSLNYVLQLKGDEKNIILGWDIAGIVTEAGPAVTRFKADDEVFGMVKFVGQANGYAEYVAAQETDLALKRGKVSFEEAAGVGIAAMTAWQSIVTGGKIKKGDKVVITGASGGVGHYAVQFAKHFGAYVIAVASAGNRDFVLGLGADEFIDYQTQAFEELVTDADLVHDAVWSDDLRHIERSLRAIKPGGTLLSLIVDFDHEISELLKSKNVTGYRVLVHKSEENLAAIAELLATGDIKTHVSQTFPLEEMAKAHSLIETKNAVGKIIVTV
jgi:NADPH:quinone reductase-like Zn-dependent oxidoreductase